MTIQTANNKTRGVRTFYVNGDSGNRYVVQLVRRARMRRASCNCPDFMFRGSTKRTHRSCKHIRAVRARFAGRVVGIHDDLAPVLRASIARIVSRRNSGIPNSCPRCGRKLQEGRRFGSAREFSCECGFSTDVEMT